MKRHLAATLRLAVALLLLALPAQAEFGAYKDLRNDFMKVIAIKEFDKTEEKFVDVGGRVENKVVPYKEIRVTAELTQKPPSTLDGMFGDENAIPFFKICMIPYDAAGQALEDTCKALRFESLVKGNIGAALFRLPDGATRYEFTVIKKVPSKSDSIKLWYPKQ